MRDADLVVLEKVLNALEWYLPLKESRLFTEYLSTYEYLRGKLENRSQIIEKKRNTTVINQGNGSRKIPSGQKNILPIGRLEKNKRKRLMKHDKTRFSEVAGTQMERSDFLGR